MNPPGEAHSPQPVVFSRHRALLLGVGILLVVVVVALLVLIPHQQFGGWDFRVNLWGPARLLVNGQSPYRTEALVAVDPTFGQVKAIWFPPAIGPFLPVGWLDPYLASDLWLLANALLVLVLIRWVRGEEAVSRSLFLLIPLYLILFLPLLTHLVLGQFSLLVVFALLVAARLAAQKRWIWAGLAIVLALGKPQLAILVVPGLWIAAIRDGGKRGAVVLPAAAVLGTVLTTIPFWIGYPAWTTDLIQVLWDNPFWFQPTLYTNLRLLWGDAGWILPGLLSFGFLGLNLWLWAKYPPEEVIPWSLALTTVASPYIWTWDFVLLIPLMLRSLYRQKSGWARVVWGAGLALCFGLMTWIRLFLLAPEDKRHHFYTWVPWLILLLALASHLVESWWRARAGDAL